MKPNSFFIPLLLIIILVGIGGYLYKEGYVSTPSKEKSNAEVVLDSISKEKELSKDFFLIEDITPNLINKSASIKGSITKRFEHESGHVFLTVEDETGSIQVPVFADKGILTDAFQKGTQIEVSGEIEEYNGELELIPQSDTDIRKYQVSETKVNKEMIGHKVDIQGKIVSKYTHPEGHLFLNVALENSEEITVPLFSNMNPNSNEFPINSVVQILGEVNEYKGDLQITLKNREDIKVTKMGSDMDIKEVDIQNLTFQDRGRMVIVEGFVKDIEPRTDGHLKFYLLDGNKKIKTVLFRADTNEIKGRRDRVIHAEEAKFPIKVIGMVDVYEDELEIIVDKVLND